MVLAQWSLKQMKKQKYSSLIFNKNRLFWYFIAVTS